MKKAILIIVFFLTSAVSQVLAQPMGRMGFNQSPGIHQLIIQYGDELQLTNDQKDELIALQMEHRNQIRSNWASGRRGGRGTFRGQGRRNGGPGMRGQGYRNPGTRGVGNNNRAELRAEALEILTDDQRELLQSKMIEQAEDANEFRTLRHEYMVNEAGIEGDKAEQVLNLLNTQSESHLEMAKQMIENPDQDPQELFDQRFQQMSDTDDELRNILTVDQYDNLRKNMGFGFGNRSRAYPGRGYCIWN